MPKPRSEMNQLIKSKGITLIDMTSTMNLEVFRDTWIELDMKKDPTRMVVLYRNKQTEEIFHFVGEGVNLRSDRIYMFMGRIDTFRYSPESNWKIFVERICDTQYKREESCCICYEPSESLFPCKKCSMLICNDCIKKLDNCPQCKTPYSKSYHPKLLEAFPQEILDAYFSGVDII